MKKAALPLLTLLLATCATRPLPPRPSQAEASLSASPRASEAGADGSEADDSGANDAGVDDASADAALPAELPAGGASLAGSQEGPQAPAPPEEPRADESLIQALPEPSQVPRRLDFRNGEPQVPVGLMEGRREVAFSPRRRMRMDFGGPDERVLEAPAGSWWTVRVTQGEPAVLSARVQLAEFPFADKEGLAEAQAQWEARGLVVRAHVLGSLYGIAGKVIDNRRYLLLVDEALSPTEASRRQKELLRRLGVRTTLFEEVQRPASAILEVRDEAGSVVGLAQDTLKVETLEQASDDGGDFLVKQVEFGVGYDFHGFEDRRFRGALELSVDRRGLLAVVNVVPLEELLKGLVPSEIYARAPAEALKAQAVTARGEVLAKVGVKHLADPYLLCSEQHCAVYRGRTGEAPSTTAAVEATRGQALFSGEGRLVDSVYSAVCGGHTEDNDVVWGGPANPSLRGRPDLLHPAPGQPAPSALSQWLWPAQELPAACRLASFSRASKFRWDKRFSAEQLNALTAHLGVGPVLAMTLSERGVSGRARVLTLSGERGATQVRGELNIRRLFGMLNSSMAVVTAERDAEGRPTAWVFRGGGWGHGVGMCQMGAIGRAEAGHDYRAILRHYYNGAEVAPIY